MTRTSSGQDVVEGAWKGNDQVMATEVRGANSVEKSPQRGEWEKEVTKHFWLLESQIPNRPDHCRLPTYTELLGMDHRGKWLVCS